MILGNEDIQEGSVSHSPIVGVLVFLVRFEFLATKLRSYAGLQIESQHFLQIPLYFVCGSLIVYYKKPHRGAE